MLKVHSGAAAGAAALFLCGLLIAGKAQAAAPFAVNPLLLTLPADKLATSLTLGNRGDQPVTVQVELLAWNQDSGKDSYAPATGLVTSPPIFTLAPGASQIVRVGRPKRSAAPPREQAFRIRLAELALKTDQAQTVTTLMRVSLPVFVPPADRGAKAAVAVTAATPTGRDLRLNVANTGLVHDKLVKLTLIQDGQTVAERALNYYMLAGARRELAWPAALAKAKPGKLELRIQLEGRDRFLTQQLDFGASPPVSVPAQTP